MAGKVKAKKAGRHQFYDLELLVSIIFLCVFGLVMIYSASSYKAQLDYYTTLIKGHEDWEFAGMYSDEGIPPFSTGCRISSGSGRGRRATAV